jgi:hypothetical protein
MKRKEKTRSARTILKTQKSWNELGRKDSNLRMSVPKTDALPLGDAPFIELKLGPEIPSKNSNEVLLRKVLTQFFKVFL